MDHHQSSQDGRSPTLLGLFLQPTYNICNRPQIFGLPTPRFFPISDEGKELKEGRWGTLDASLSFIGRTVYIKASSGGFLLCCYEINPQDHYCICNPVTREWQDLPVPKNVEKYAALAFSCRGGETSLDRVQFTVIRAWVTNSLELTTDLEIETFSSETGEWRESRVACAQPFGRIGARRPAFAIDQVMYLWDTHSCLLVYNSTVESLEQVEPPGDAGSFFPYVDLWGRSEGRIFYARHDRECLEVWTVEKNQRQQSYQYQLVARENLAVLFELTLETMARHGKKNFSLLGIIAFHPLDRRLIMLKWNGAAYWYNVASSKVDKFTDSSADHGMITLFHFLYEWPSSPVNH